MIRAIVVGLMWCCLVSDVSARPIARDPSQKLWLADLLEVRSDRYFEGRSYSRFPGSERKLHIVPDGGRDPLERVFSRSRARLYMVQPKDTLHKIARRHGTTIEFIKQLSRIKSDRLRPGQCLWISDQFFILEINKTLNRLYLKSGDVVIKEYPVSTGRSAKQTPVGIFFIQSRYPYPTWFHQGVVISSVSPKNYLGSRWLGLDKPAFGIHGTIFPELIGRSVSKGCIRMKNEDVEELYEFIPMGTMVLITEI